MKPRDPIAWSGANPGGRMRLPEREQRRRKRKMNGLRKKTLLSIMLLLMTLVPIAYARKAGKGAEFALFRNTGHGVEVVNPDACGKVIFNQPEGAVSVVITGIVHGLPEGTYFVYLYGGWTDGIVKGEEGQTLWGHFHDPDINWLHRPWARVTSFTVNELGDGSFHYNIRADWLDAYEYTLTVWIDKAPTATTHLVSLPITVTITE